jgi:hypothetical protein
MTEGLSIIWAAPRAVSASEKRVIATAARAADAQVLRVSMSALARELGPTIVQGPVVVFVGSSKDAATALDLGADEVVHVVRSMPLHKATIGGAIERARARARARMRGRRAAIAKSAARDASGDAFLIRVLERRLGSPLDVATTRCKGLADQLKGAVAAVDHLMRRVQKGAKATGLKTWRGDVKDYARATLKAEALAVELEEQVGRTNGLVQALDDLSLDTQTSETDAASLLVQFAEFLRDGLPEGATLQVDAPTPCVVSVPRATVVGMLSNAIDSALYNMLEGKSIGRVSLRAAVTDSKTVVVEVADDGAPAAPLLHASAKDPSFSDSRAERLRHLRKRARRAGGEMIVKSHVSGNVLSLYLPTVLETTACASWQEPSRAHPRRHRRVGPPDESASSHGTVPRTSEPRNS